MPHSTGSSENRRETETIPINRAETPCRNASKGEGTDLARDLHKLVTLTNSEHEELTAI